MPKMTRWYGPLATGRFKTPTGPLADVDPGMCFDYTKQRAVLPKQLGAEWDPVRPMNASGVAAQADVTSLETNGTDSPFVKPAR